MEGSVIGIVAEYNPFHKGHAYQIATARKLLGNVPVVAVMSGSFTQRGDAALLDKWSRAQLAIAGGVDLVLELPAIYACRSSEYFARGAVGTLAATGVVTHLAFGTESVHPESLAALAKEKPDSKKLKEYLKAGLTYGAAIEKALAGTVKSSERAEAAVKAGAGAGVGASADAGTYVKADAGAALLKGPNNILALAYYKALAEIHSPILPLPITRQGTQYNDHTLSTQLPSAAAIRAELLSGGCTDNVQNALPPKVRTLFKKILKTQTPCINKEKAALLLSYLLRTSSPEKIALFCDCSEGLENKILQAANCQTVDAIVAAIKSKRYPATRIQRLLCQLLISTDQVPFTATAHLSPSYIRVLCFNDIGRTLLRQMKKTATLPVLTKLTKNIFKDKGHTPFALTLQTEIAATNLYDLLSDTDAYNRDYTTTLK